MKRAGWLASISGGTRRAAWAVMAACVMASNGLAVEPGTVVAPGVVKAGEIEHYALVESSGLTASGRHPGVFWTHNDTESPAFLFGMTAEGQHIGAYEVQGARLIDWEAVAWHGGALYFADTGTNGMTRTHSAIHRVEEPEIENTWGPARVRETWFVRFPGGQREDCEGFFVWEGYGYLVGKYPVEDQVPMYRFWLEDDSESILLELTAWVDAPGQVSDAFISEDGQRMGLVTEEGVMVFFIRGDPRAAGRSYRQFTEFESDVMEGGAFVPEGVLVTSEGVRDIYLFTDPVLRGAPVITAGLANQTAFVGDTVRFEVGVLGFPAPAVEWRFNGELIEGATNAFLVLTNVMLEAAGEYEARVVNAAGEARSTAVLTVVERTADVRITEVMANPAENTVELADWWELTSFDPRPIELSGWRYNESTGGLEDAWVFPEGLVIEPGESIVFVEELTAEEFRTWWGPELGEEVQIITFEGAELSFNSMGDSARLWNADGEAAELVQFGPAAQGVTFGYDPAAEEFGILSEAGVHGAWRAVNGGDVGSPGTIGAAPGEIELRFERDGEDLRIRAAVPEEGSYRLEESLDLVEWQTAGEASAAGEGEVVYEIENGAAFRFYRVRRE